MRSLQAAAFLYQSGFENVKSLAAASISGQWKLIDTHPLLIKTYPH